MIEAVQARFADLCACSFDRGFHSPANRLRLDALLEHNFLPRKGRIAQADRIREEDPALVAARQQHPAVESAIHNLSTAASTGCGFQAEGLGPCRSPLGAGPPPASPWAAAAAPGGEPGRDDEPPPDGAVVEPTGGNPPADGTNPHARTAVTLGTSRLTRPNPPRQGAAGIRIPARSPDHAGPAPH